MTARTLVGEAVIEVSSGAEVRPGVVEATVARPEKSFRVEQLDGLRGLAALFAISYHYLFLAGPGTKWHLVDALQLLLAITPISIDTFFILSGFLIGGILLRAKGSPHYYRTFYFRRFFRILPLYYVWIGIYFAFFLIGKGWGLRLPAGCSTPFVFASFLLMIQNFFPVIIESSYMIAPTWTLAMEEHFYLLAPYCVRRLDTRRLIQFLLAVIVIAPLLRGFLFKFVGHGDAWSTTAIYIWTPCHADALAMGVLLAIAWTSPTVRDWLRHHSSFLPWGMFVFSGVTLLFLYLNNADVPHTFLLAACFSRTAVELSCLCLMIFVLVRPETRFCDLLRTRFLRETGKLSYCLYLVHWGVLWMVSRFMLHTRFGDRPALDLLAAVIALPLSYGVAALSWKFLEHPLIRRGHRYTY